jgi:hypothetical protein
VDVLLLRFPLWVAASGAGLSAVEAAEVGARNVAHPRRRATPEPVVAVVIAADADEGALSPGIDRTTKPYPTLEPHKRHRGVVASF